MGFRGLNQKSKKQFCRGAHGELTAKKWLDSIEKQKRRSNLKERDRHPDRQTESIVDSNDSYLGAEINTKLQYRTKLSNSNKGTESRKPKMGCRGPTKPSLQPLYKHVT